MSKNNISFILHKPQLSENIGACARSMKNFGFKKLKIVRLKNKVAIITGSASGFGKGIAKKFTEEGAKLILVDINSNLLKRLFKYLYSIFFLENFEKQRR